MHISINEILALPRSQQLAIAQAILANLQVEEGNNASQEVIRAQAGLAEKIAADVDAGKMQMYSLEAFREQIERKRQ